MEKLFGPGFRERQTGIAARCRELGLAFEPAEVLSNSRPAIEASEFAREAGAFPAFHRAVLAAYFAHGRDIGDVNVLEDVAAEVGLDPVGLRESLQAGSYSAARKAAEEEARHLAVTAVPTFIFAGTTRVVGAQQIDYFRQVLRAW